MECVCGSKCKNVIVIRIPQSESVVSMMPKISPFASVARIDVARTPSNVCRMIPLSIACLAI